MAPATRVTRQDNHVSRIGGPELREVDHVDRTMSADIDQRPLRIQYTSREHRKPRRPLQRGHETQPGIIGAVDDAMGSVSDMPMPETVLTFLRKPNPAVMATVTSDGRPVSVATWYLIEDDGLLTLCMNDDHARLKHLQNNGQVSLTVLAADDFGTHISVQGHVVSISPDEGLADIDRLSQHFLGKDYPARDRPLVTVHVEIDRWFGWSGGRPLQY